MQHLQTPSWKCSKTIHGKPGLKKKRAFSEFLHSELVSGGAKHVGGASPRKKGNIPILEERFFNFIYFAALLLWAPRGLNLWSRCPLPAAVFPLGVFHEAQSDGFVKGSFPESVPLWFTGSL